MNQPAQVTVPFVDIHQQHAPLQAAMLTAFADLLDRGDFILGQAVGNFEAHFAQVCGAAHGVGVGCGTDAIALGLVACGLAPGDEVMLPANTFVATLIGVLRAHGKPVLVDCDPTTGLLDCAAAEQAITPQTRAIVPVHLYGQMVSPEALLDLAQRHGLMIFEDAAQAHLAEREGFQAGSVGMAAGFSFYPSKNLGALGDGGMLVTSDASVAETARSLRNYGAIRKYYHTEPAGTNSRLDTLQAMVLDLKLPHLATWNQTRYHLAQHYDRLLLPLRDHGIVPVENQAGAGHVYHLYVVRVTPTCPVSRAELQQNLAAVGIETGIHYPRPCHLQPAFESLGYGPGSFPQAERLSQEILSLPMHPGMTAEQVELVAKTIHHQVTRTVPSLVSINSRC